MSQIQGLSTCLLHRRTWRGICFLGLCLCALLFASSARAVEQPILLLDSPDRHLTLAGQARYLIDPSATATVEQILALEDARYTLFESDHLALGYSAEAVWLSLAVQLPDDSLSRERWLLGIDYPLLDHVDVYQLTDDGPEMIARAGDRLPFDSRPIDHRFFVFPLPIEGTNVLQVLVRIESTSSLQIRPLLVRQDQFLSFEKRHELVFGVIYGIMLLMALYNLFLFAFVRDPSYLAYVCATGTALIFIMALNGHAFAMLWPNQPEFANTVVPLSSALWVMATVWFTRQFLNVDSVCLLLSRILVVLMGLSSVAVVLSLAAPYSLAIQASTGLALITGLVVLITALVCWSRGIREARFFALGCLFYQGGAALLILSRFGAIPDTFLTHNSASLGVLVEIVMLSIALSDKYRMLTRCLARSADDLERRVLDQTRELNDANQQLERLTLQDELTCLSNRRYFTSELERLWQQHVDGNSDLSLLLCDIDHFKRINDSFGHEVGDRCLVRVADRIAVQAAAQGYRAARLGGDEFAVILPKASLTDATRLAHSLLEEVRDTALPEGLDAGQWSLSLSIGIATRRPSDSGSITQLMQQADEAMYRAKQQGRDCVVVHEQPRTDSQDVNR